MSKVWIRWVLPVLALGLASCASNNGVAENENSEKALHPDGYVFDSDYGHGSWDPDDPTVNTSTDLPSEYRGTINIPEPNFPSAPPRVLTSAPRPTPTAPSQPTVAAVSRIPSPPAPSRPIVSAPQATSRPAPAAPPRGVSGFYTVGKGDTLWGIARAHGTSVDSLKSVNSLTSDNIQPGQKLRIVGGRAPVATLSRPKPAPAPTSGLTHTVSQGETFWSISRRYKVPIATIKSVNSKTSDLLKAGDTLRIPKGS